MSELKACPFCGNPNYFLCPCDVDDYIYEITNLRAKLDDAVGALRNINKHAGWGESWIIMISNDAIKRLEQK